MSPCHRTSHSQEKTVTPPKKTAEMEIARVESLRVTDRENFFLNLSIILGVFTFGYLIFEHRGPELLCK